jgi:hypothetical protein
MRQHITTSTGIDESQQVARPLCVHVETKPLEADCCPNAREGIPERPAIKATSGVKEAKEMFAMVPVSTRAVEALRQSAIPALRQLMVEENDTMVVISGRVGTYYLKQLAQETVMPVRGDRRVENRVLVHHG